MTVLHNVAVIELDPRDLRIDVWSTGTGPTRDSAVRVTHEPTGISAECDDYHSEIWNRRVATERLQEKLRQQ